jgi:hypothetical protein
MKQYDYFLNYTEEDLIYEFDMLCGCRLGIGVSDWFLHCLCMEGWLLHTRRIIEVFRLDTLDKKWEIRWGLISEHLSHANPSNRTNTRKRKRENPEWDPRGYYDELIDAVMTVADQHKADFAHYDVLIRKLNLVKGVEGS